jgi:hypothetical protein
VALYHARETAHRQARLSAVLSVEAVSSACAEWTLRRAVAGVAAICPTYPELKTMTVMQRKLLQNRELFRVNAAPPRVPSVQGYDHEAKELIEAIYLHCDWIRGASHLSKAQLTAERAQVLADSATEALGRIAKGGFERSP